ncbi:hypothetical protein FGO68_gene7433 [Halteria grandinella]|uniref:Uncharacterized protein n=1 Tax=Halteria grandinella TaxID=5974 RepID=A0A8J8SWV4_HALGN|nr:hypothetical protein FGO68_gene7433 [Halteria grandinella]
MTSARGIASMKQRFIENPKDCPPQYKGLHPFLWRAYSLGFKEEPDYDEFKYLLTFLIPRDPPGLNKSLEMMLQLTASNLLLEIIDQWNLDFLSKNQKLREGRLIRIINKKIKTESDENIRLMRDFLQQLLSHMIEKRQQAQILEDETVQNALDQISKNIQIEILENELLSAAIDLSNLHEEIIKKKTEREKIVIKQTILPPIEDINESSQEETPREKPIEQEAQDCDEVAPQQHLETKLDNEAKGQIDKTMSKDQSALVIEYLSPGKNETNVYREAIRKVNLSGLKRNTGMDQRILTELNYEQTSNNFDEENKSCDQLYHNISEADASEEFEFLQNEQILEPSVEVENILRQEKLKYEQEEQLQQYFNQGNTFTNLNSIRITNRNYESLDHNEKKYLYTQIFCYKPLIAPSLQQDFMMRKNMKKQLESNDASSDGFRGNPQYKQFAQEYNYLIELEIILAKIKIDHGRIKYEEIQKYLFKNFQEYKELIKLNNNRNLPQNIDAVFAFFRTETFLSNPNHSPSFKISQIQKTIISIKDAVYNVLKMEAEKAVIKDTKRKFQIIINSIDTFEHYLEKQGRSPDNIHYIILVVTKSVITKAGTTKLKKIKNLLFSKVRGSGKLGKRIEWLANYELEPGEYQLSIQVAYSYDNGKTIYLETVNDPKPIFIKYLPNDTTQNLQGNVLKL